MHHYFLPLINGGGPLCTIQRLKPICDKLPSSCAFNFNLRCYIKNADNAKPAESQYSDPDMTQPARLSCDIQAKSEFDVSAGRCRLTLS